MLYVQTSDGRSHRFDLENEDGARAWLECQRDPDFQATIRGLALHDRGVRYFLPPPRDFDGLIYTAEAVRPNGKLKGGEQVTCFAGDVRVTMLVHRETRAVRFGVVRQGRPRYVRL